MAVTFMLSVWILLTYIVESNADICRHGHYGSVVCIFGCCNDYSILGVSHAYCCLSNGAGIAIITVCVAVVLSIVGCCCRRARYNRSRPPAVIYHQGAPAVSIVSSTASHYGFNSSHLTDTSAPPPYPGIPSTSTYTNNNSYWTE